MSFQDCSVEFHGSPQGVLCTGREITGVFHIKQDQPKEIQGLYFKVTGKTKTQWSVNHGSGKNRRTTTYHGLEINLETENVTLLGGYPVQSNRSVIIKAGHSKFNFSFTLPSGLPSSFEGLHGKTRYKMNVTAERKGKFDKTKKFPFTVICPIDLNLNLENRMPINQVVSKKFSFCGCDRGTLNVTIDLPMRGYAPRQLLPIKCLVKNDSRVFIEGVVFCLEYRVTYFSSHPTKNTIKEKEKKATFIGHPVGKDSESLLEVALSIPDLPASRPVDKVITIEYFVKIKVVVTGMHFNLKTEVPVNIGTIPVHTQNFANPSRVAQLEPQHLGVRATAFYPSCPDLSQAPRPNIPGIVTPGSQFPPLPNSRLTPFDSPQFPSLQNSQLPSYRSLHLLPTPSAPPLRSDDLGLPTYEEAQRMAKMTKDNTEDGDRGADHSPQDT